MEEEKDWWVIGIGARSLGSVAQTRRRGRGEEASMNLGLFILMMMNEKSGEGEGGGRRRRLGGGGPREEEVELLVSNSNCGSARHAVRTARRAVSTTPPPVRCPWNPTGETTDRSDSLASLSSPHRLFPFGRPLMRWARIAPIPFPVDLWLCEHRGRGDRRLRLHEMLRLDHPRPSNHYVWWLHYLQLFFS